MNAAIKFLKKKHVHDTVVVSIASIFGWMMFSLPLMAAFGERSLKICFHLAITAILAVALKSAIPLLRVQNMPKALGLGSLAEVDKYLQKCECLNYAFFKSTLNQVNYYGNISYLSDRHIIDFRSGKVIPLSDIVSLKPDQIDVTSGENSCETFDIINFKTSKRRKYRIFFDDENYRDKTMKRLSAYSDFAKGQKYID